MLGLLRLQQPDRDTLRGGRKSEERQETTLTGRQGIMPQLALYVRGR